MERSCERKAVELLENDCVHCRRIHDGPIRDRINELYDKRNAELSTCCDVAAVFGYMDKYLERPPMEQKRCMALTIQKPNQQ